MMSVILLIAAVLALACAAGIVVLTNGHELAAFLMVVGAAVLLAGACLVHALRQGLGRRGPD